MSDTKYTFYNTNFINNLVDSSSLSSSIRSSNITTSLDYINVFSTGGTGFECDIFFKSDLSTVDLTTLSGVVAAHTGIAVESSAPVMSDGRPLVRTESRPLGTRTYFTSQGDNLTTGKFGEGKAIMWDFSTDEDLFDATQWINAPTMVSGYKAKYMNLAFNTAIYVKDGNLWHYDAPWGSFCSMYVTVPSGSYFPNSYGTIPAAALGLTTGGYYSHATKNVFYSCYVKRQRFYGSSADGMRFEAEGCQINALPSGWYITIVISTLEDDVSSKGFGRLQLFRTDDITLKGVTF